MVEQEDPELTFSHGHIRITVIYRATIDEKDKKTSRKDILQLDNIEKESQQDGQEGQKSGMVKIHIPKRVTHK